MYGEAFFQRISVQQLSEFFRQPYETLPREKGTLAQRAARAEAAYDKALMGYRDRVRKTDWEAIPPGLGGADGGAV